jgi:hypothetical protein
MYLTMMSINYNSAYKRPGMIMLDERELHHVLQTAVNAEVPLVPWSRDGVDSTAFQLWWPGGESGPHFSFTVLGEDV